MAFCPNCGAQAEGRFCAKCGSSIQTATAEAGAGGAPGAQAYSSGPVPGAAPVGGAQPYTAGAATGGLTDNVAGALAYAIGLVTGILFLALAPYNQNKFIRFHAFQAIFFHVGWIAMWFVYVIVSMMLPFSLSFLVTLLMMVVGLGGFLCWLFLMYKAYSGERFKLPVIGELAEKQA